MRDDDDPCGVVFSSFFCHARVDVLRPTPDEPLIELYGAKLVNSETRFYDDNCFFFFF